jgi:hypothetical protein
LALSSAAAKSGRSRFQRRTAVAPGSAGSASTCGTLSPLATRTMTRSAAAWSNRVQRFFSRTEAANRQASASRAAKSGRSRFQRVS